MTGLLETVGAQPRNPSKGKPIHVARMETGLVTNRSALHDPANWFYSKYGGYVDALIDGSNMEISNALTVIRRPGLSEWSTQTVPNPPNWFYDWRKLDTSVNVVVDTSTATYIQTATTQTQIFTKSAGAGQGYYQGVGNTLYYGDGVDLQQFTGTAVWNWGIAQPTVAPTVTITETASAATAWIASTVFSTMGLLVDSNGNIQQLISVNASGINLTQLGTSGNGEPAWNQTPGGTTTDGSITWTNYGPIVPWAPNKVFNNGDPGFGGTLVNPAMIYDPISKSCQFNDNTSPTSGATSTHEPAFSGTVGFAVHDGAVRWHSLGSPAAAQPWKPLTSYPLYGSTGENRTGSVIVEPVGLTGGLPNNLTVFWHVSSGGVSGAAGTAPPWSQVVGQQTYDKDLIWLCLGSGTRQTVHQYNAWTVSGSTFSAIVDSNNNYQVCIVGGISSPTATGSVNWSTVYGQTTVDGSVTWVCVGSKMTWAANTQWYLPTSGFFPPGGSVPFGGAIIVDSNSNVQAVVSSGKSGAGPHPTWATVTGVQTVDNAATWQMVGAFTTAGFSWTKGIQYAYSYSSRTANDIYNTTAPPDWPSALGPPTGSETGGVSTASPLFIITGPNPGAVNTLVIPCSSDPQVDTIIIWRTLDGGSSLFFLTEVPNIQPIGGVQQFQTVQDSQSDSVINELISAPIADSNNPPPAGFLPMAYHFQRIWGAIGNFVFCSGGPDVVTGNPNESFDPLDFFEFPSAITRIVPTATALLVFLTSDVYAILGGPLFSTFFASPMIPGVGLLHYNALDIHGAVIYLYSADNQFLALDPSSGVNRMGGLIADKLAMFNANSTYVTVHESGNDNAIFVSDGSTGWYRLNPSQFPNGNQVWSPFATITGGAKAVLSIEVSKGVHRLLVGPTGNNGFILQRDFSTYQDNGASYTCFFTMGSINLVNPGQIAGLTFTDIRATKVGTTPSVAFLLNEISGSFTTFPQPQAYPWQVYGATKQSSSLYSNAYYFRAAGVPALAEHCQIKVSFPAENFANEALSLTIFGTIEQAPEV